MEFDISRREIRINTNAGFLFVNGGNKLDQCELTVEKWQSIKAMLYRAKTQQWESMEINTIEKLVDICEFEVEEKIIFFGFGAITGQWIEIIISNALIKVRCDLANNH